MSGEISQGEEKKNKVRTRRYQLLYLFKNFTFRQKAPDVRPTVRKHSLNVGTPNTGNR
jgi:hypothetical protein